MNHFSLLCMINTCVQTKNGLFCYRPRLVTSYFNWSILCILRKYILRNMHTMKTNTTKTNRVKTKTNWVKIAKTLVKLVIWFSVKSGKSVLLTRQKELIWKLSVWLEARGDLIKNTKVTITIFILLLATFFLKSTSVITFLWKFQVIPHIRC